MTDRAVQLAETKGVYHPSAMVEKPGFVLRVLGRTFFDRVNFDQKYVTLVNRLSRQGTVVYVMNSQSFLDYLYFNWVFLKLGLPLAWFTNGIRLFESLVVRRVMKVLGLLFAFLFGRVRLPKSDVASLRESVERERSAMIFLKKARAILQWGDVVYKEELLAELIALQRQSTRPIILLPQILIWKQKPDRYKRSIFDLVFGHPDAPGRVRKLINFVLNHRKAFVQLGEPVDLSLWLRDNPPEPGESDDTALARRLGWTLHRELAVEQKVIKGPVLKNARQIRSELLRNKELQTEMDAIAKETGQSKDAVVAATSRYLKEIAADFKMGYIEAFCMLLTVLWRILYSGGQEGIEVDEDGLDRLREAGRRAPLIIVPTHRSHIDYLIISYLFYAHGLIPPHIAAGVNLSFWPMGHIFRHSGAFFIRRSFRDNPIYGLAFRFYLRKIVKEGYWIEFFMEGGRSRTGKLLPPRYGMLHELVTAVRSGSRDDLLFCPVSISYEKIIEEGSYTRELTGAEKNPENVGSMIKATKALASKYGRLYVQFAEPVSLRQFLADKEISDDLALDRDRENDLVKRFAYRIMAGMNEASVVTPSSLVSMVLLSHLRRGISRSNLLTRVGWLINYMAGKKAVLSKTLRTAMAARRALLERPDELPDTGPKPEGALAYGKDLRKAQAIGAAVDNVIEETLGLFIKGQLIQVRNFGDELVYQVIPDRRINLDMSKNNLVQHVAREAILSTCFLALRGRNETARPVPEAQLRRESKFLSRLLKREFVYEESVPFDVQFDSILDQFLDAGWIQRDEAGLVTMGTEAGELMVFFARAIANFVESYWFAVQHLAALAEGVAKAPGPQLEKEWLKDLHRLADRFYHEGLLTYREANSSVTFKNALDVMLEQKVVRRREQPGEGRRGRPVRILELADGGLPKIAEMATRISQLRLAP